MTDSGRSPSGSGYSAKPEPSCTVSAVPVSIPNAIRRVPDMDALANGIVIFECGDKRVQIDERELMLGGIKLVRQYFGISPSTDRLEVRQSGRLVGYLPADFDPLFIRSTSFLYDPRPGDFVLDGDHWIASGKLGPGDLECVPGFVALAAAARQGGDVQQAPAESPQSGGDSRNAHKGDA